MTDLELKDIWQQRAAQAMSISSQQVEEITKLKVQQSLSVVQRLKSAGLIAGILWVLFVDSVLIAVWKDASPFFLASALLQVITIKIAIGIYLYQITLINQVNCFTPVLQTQQKLAQLKVAGLWTIRVLMLQLPAWTTFYLHAEMFKTQHVLLLLLQLIVTLAAVLAAIWLFVNIRFENRNKQWFRLLFSGNEWWPIIKAMDILEESTIIETGE